MWTDVIKVDAASYPHLHAAFRAIEFDNGGHLIGRVYPGAPVDLDTFRVPGAWAEALPPAEAALATLAGEPDTLDSFIVGEQSEQEGLMIGRPDLRAAHKVLNDYFDGWQPEDAPNPENVPVAATWAELVKALAAAGGPRPVLARAAVIAPDHILIDATILVEGDQVQVGRLARRFNSKEELAAAMVQHGPAAVCVANPERE